MNTRQCERCRMNFIDEEFSSHVCTPYMKGIKEILIDFYLESTTQYGDKQITAFGLDGRIYDLVVCKHNPLHKSKNPNLTFALYQTTLNSKKNNDNLPEPLADDSPST